MVLSRRAVAVRADLPPGLAAQLEEAVSRVEALGEP